ncbi:ATP-binding cassette, subfamily C [Sporobacter termitidis DSM 10068]|uniref:ATP-binding cassette, subfamily C n=1 Tax=Sporobacter termitidis DSM 10068 TaxID=1123282 RepID=A0A1M5WLC6_9FIRM|nr:DUF454 family protein [Sporobacter termitidis]SHH88297.1 ATP-binding cassette, subfamily C [Sporobacter termitidis DSM 10068]
MAKAIYITLGFLFLFLGAIGVVLPFLPTTPFLLAAAFCFARGSARFHRWFTETKLYRKYLGDYVKKRAMTTAAKLKVLASVTALLALGGFLTHSLHARIAMGVVLLGHYYYFLFRMKTIQPEKPASARKRLWDLIGGARKDVALTVLFRWLALLGSIAATASFAYLLQKGFAQVFSPAVLLIPALVFAAAIAFRFFCIRLGTEFSRRTSAKVKKTLRAQIYDKLLSLGLSYREKTSTAAVAQMSVEGVEQLQVYLSGFLPQLFYSVLAPVTLFCLFALFNLRVAAILLALVPLIPLCMLLIGKIAGKLMKKHWGQYTDLGRGFLESLQGLTTLKIYNADEKRHEAMNASAEGFRKITMKVLRMQLGSVTVMDLIAYGGTALGVWAALSEVSAGNMQLWGGVLVILLSSEFFLPLRLLGSFFHSSMNGLAAAEDIFSLLDSPEPEQKTDAAEAFDIRLTACGFAYEPGRSALQELSLTLPAGSFVSVIGESGCGKSTLANILSGTLQSYTGSVLLGGAELSGMSGESIRRRIALVEHNSYIFKGTVADNLSMGCPGASDKAMWDALHKAGLDEFVIAEGGLGMPLREGGSNLSGGQRQRLAMARVLLYDADVYIFDEATSNMDAESEAWIMETLYALSESGKTVILITHRMALARRSPRILVMRDGAVAGIGTHDALYRENPYYAGLFDVQHSLEHFEETTEGVLC